ncbi:MAG: hypothetical protein RL129_355, partial [Actinomycetota bacterium]
MSILTAIEILPLIGSLVIAFSPKDNAKLVKQIALGTSLLVAVVSVLMALKFDKSVSGFQFTESRTWISAFHINYAVGVDGMALVLIVMSTILVPIVFLAGWNESENGRFGVKTFYVLMLVLETMMIGVFAATDVFLFYVIFEAMLIPVYFLIGGYGRGERAAAAMKFLIYSLVGGLLMLAALIGTYIISTNQIGGSFDVTKLSEMTIDSATQNWLFLGFFIAFAIKAPLWPLHTWLPTAARSSSAGVATLLLGVLDKVGTYGMIRFCMTLFPEATRTFTPAIITLAVISILYGAFLAIGQRDINSLISFTSISHFGFITLGIFALTSQGLSGASFYMVNHGFSTAALFLVAG